MPRRVRDLRPVMHTEIKHVQNVYMHTCSTVSTFKLALGGSGKKDSTVYVSPFSAHALGGKACAQTLTCALKLRDPRSVEAAHSYQRYTRVFGYWPAHP